MKAGNYYKEVKAAMEADKLGIAGNLGAVRGNDYGSIRQVNAKFKQTHCVEQNRVGSDQSHPYPRGVDPSVLKEVIRPHTLA